VRSAGAATVAALLVATMGGFSSILGLGNAQLRAWNRLSIFIAFFALIAVAWSLDRAGQRMSSLRLGRPLLGLALAGVFVVGALDQTNTTYVPGYAETAASYEDDRDFVRRIESRMPENAAVFQLPYASFPESVPPPPGRTVVYDSLRPYIHSQDLRWSSGAMRGSRADWAGRLADVRLRTILPVVSALGFDGILLDRLGYDTDAAADKAEGELRMLVGQPSMSNDDGRLLFFDLRAYNERFRAQHTEEKIADIRHRALARA
jgi:phosphoglycerol transferase